jgi:hypothetical protein
VVGLKLIFLIVTRAVSLLGLSQRIADIPRKRIKRPPVLGGPINENERAA